MIYHKTWNPWIYENGSLRRTSETTFFRPLTYKKPIRIFVGTNADFFDPAVPHTWRKDAVEIMSKQKNLTFLIPSAQPDFTCILPNTWIGLKITDNTNLIKLLKSIEHLPFVILSKGGYCSTASQSQKISHLYLDVIPKSILEKTDGILLTRVTNVRVTDI
jgi:hypothetical protein